MIKIGDRVVSLISADSLIKGHDYPVLDVVVCSCGHVMLNVGELMPKNYSGTQCVPCRKIHSGVVLTDISLFRKIEPKVEYIIKEVEHAFHAIKESTMSSYNTYGVKTYFNDNEGFYKLDGTQGLTLVNVSGYDFDEDLIDVEHVTHGGDGKN